MASLIKRPNSPFWIACFDVPQPDGTIRRLKKSTKQTKRADALKTAMNLEATAQKSATSTTETGSQAFAVLADAAASAARGELSEGRAREILAKLSEISTGQPLRFFTVASWRDEWLEMKAPSIKAPCLRLCRDHTDAFLAWLGDRAKGKLESITKADVRAFRDAIHAGWNARPKILKGKPVPCHRTAKTANLYAANVSSMFRAATRDGLLIVNPCAAIARLPELDSMTRGVFTLAEIGRLIDACPSEDWQGMILFGFYAGPRLKDCAGLKWGNLDLARKSLSFMPQKTDRKRKTLEVPLHPRLVAWLGTRTTGTDQEPIFPSMAKSAATRSSNLSEQFARIMQTAGVDRGIFREQSGTARALHARSFHSLRHSLASTLANLDVSEEIRMKITGHESRAVHAGYTHTEGKTLERAIAMMPSV